MRVLLVEDDHEIAEAVQAGLREHGMQLSWARTFAAGRVAALKSAHEVILLDVMLPGGTGFDLSRDLRKRGISTPILMLTARDAVHDRVTGLDAGADDYLTKPFAFVELLARIRALARRPRSLDPEVARIADLEVDFGSHRARRGGRSIELTAKEYALLECFARNPGRVMGRAAITAHVWDENHDPFTNVLEVLVRRLRRKLDDGFDRPLIHTVRGAGYRLGE